MTGNTADRLLKASTAYADAKCAVDEFEGERRGPEFEAACLKWRQAMTQLLRLAGKVGQEQAAAAETQTEEA